MPTVIHFPTENVPLAPEPCALTDLIRDELFHLSSNEYMVNCILERMKPFIATLDCDLELDVEITPENEEGVLQMIPSVQALQTRFDGIISEIISERILHEIHLFHIERASKL
ncbi:hypothetical protein A1OO_16930 [Enterovibrio norvegicus FF-33]|uniref:Uncharacterized protein n=1 Tax=Enterovibrio norvegicus FF-454 TaxID=1185651 RepID=A0A1E5BZ44_9GAMM|nr:hypothetical protein [Enterovibrio norvegicus]OEE58546.1 hypothetical protein A1OK_14915 [Enterovibrio norvegicus FF-454]OEE67432.1 hypothetical protein A1OO_16930 [Enterovibrio norvegicus FF-33]OEE80092.1 hypothetical protein A1OQ_21125 [Enterovibrio norvegicus FF-162]